MLVLLMADPVWADAPKTSIHPMPRPQLTEVVIGETPPVPRPMIRPRPRPSFAEQPSAPVRKTAKPKISLVGSVCGDPDIKGVIIPPVTSETKGCGISEPVKVTAIADVRLGQPATIDCETAKALKKWVIHGMQPAFRNREVVQINIYGTYSCRSRNSARGAKVSEHGRGRAVDISGFVMSNGQEWSVKRDYNATIRKAQKAACGIFGTTLGPGSDGYHEDHLHFDTARYRSGSYCR